MKKLLALSVALVMTLTSGVAASAATIDQDTSTKEAKTTVEFSVDPTYTVTIPATVELDPVTAQTGEVTSYEKDLEISAEKVRLEADTEIGVKIESDFVMETSENAEYKLPYKAYIGEQEVANKGVVAVFNTDKQSQKSTIHFVAGNPDYAGAYSDTVTFTITLVK